MSAMMRFTERIQRAEEAMKTLSIVSPECICFPEHEQPFFGFDYERDLAFATKCPLHGDRFQRRPHLFVAGWKIEREKTRRQTLSARFHKAWIASFPPSQFPGTEEVAVDEVYLRMKDGKRILVAKFNRNTS